MADEYRTLAELYRTLAEIEKAEERLLKLHERAQADPDGEDARIARLAEVYSIRNGTDLATAIAAVQRMEEGSRRTKP